MKLLLEIYLNNREAVVLFICMLCRSYSTINQTTEFSIVPTGGNFAFCHFMKYQAVVEYGRTEMETGI